MNWESTKKLSEEVRINYLITKRRYDKIVELEEDLGTYQEENSVLRAQLQKLKDREEMSDKLSEKKYYVGVDENDKKLYYTPAEICEELGDDIEALWSCTIIIEKENDKLLEGKNNCHGRNIVLKYELQKLKEFIENIEGFLPPEYKQQAIELLNQSHKDKEDQGDKKDPK